MKKHILFILIWVAVFPLFTASAQTKVIKTTASKSNDYGIEYFLPKTVLKVHIEYSKITQKAGEYARYAEKQLGIKAPDITEEDQVFYALDQISVTPIGVPNRDASYLVELKSKTTAPFVYLTEDGLICTINAEYSPEKATSPTATKSQTVQKTDPQTIFTEEYLRAGSKSKMAEILSKQIFKIRESRNDILTGEADNVPRDGEGIRLVLANLEAQEKALVEMFTGTSATEKMTAVFELEPQGNIEKQVLFRFSKYAGVVDSDDLSGSPVYINVKKTDDPVEEPVDPKRKAKEPQSIVYNIPGKARVEIYYGTNRMFDGEQQIVQFGKTQILTPSLFEDKKAPVQVYFYPHTGAIKQIIQ